MKRFIFILLGIHALLFSCKKEEENNGEQLPDECPVIYGPENMESRNFLMGFSTWPFGPEVDDLQKTYDVILKNSDVYSEQVDHHIPWKALIENDPLPAEFINNIEFRKNQKPENKRLLLSVSLLNSNRNDLLDAYDGSIPSYDSLNNPMIENAYFKYLKYLVDNFQPDYLVFAMEVNNLRLNALEKWAGYKKLANNLRTRLKTSYPSLPLSESVTLHQWFQPELYYPEAYQEEIADYIRKMDFISISYYPFLIRQTTVDQYQQSFDFLEEHSKKPVAIVETGYLSETLELEKYDITLPGDQCMQNSYLETLFKNAQDNNYMFTIWWAHRDYDKLLETFPEESQELGGLWKTTGLLHAEGNPKAAFETWKMFLEK